jgi:C1A family cysteine protease
MRPLEKVTLQNHHGYLALDNITLPSHFSWRENFTACMVPVIDQGECGSCYAHAVTSMMAERICIIENYIKNTTIRPLSPNFVMSCDPDA